MNVTEYIIEKLNSLGITDFFGVPGDYNIKILNEIEKNPNTKWIGCTNELNAGYAADGYARQKGFGAVITTYGVGELSAINAIAGSYSENVPVIHIVGTPPTDILNGKEIYHHNFQEPNSHCFIQAYKEVTEAATFLSNDNIKIEIDRVFKVLIKERKPVYIAVPEDIALIEMPEKKTDYEWISNSNTLDRACEAIIEKINKSKKPIIIADTLIKRFDAVSEFTDFVEKSCIPTANFLMGTNIINMDTENYIGTYLSKYGNPHVKEAVDGTDCLISVGVIYGDINSFGTPIPYKINSQIAIYGTYTYIDGKKYSDIKMKDVLSNLAKNINHKSYKINKNKLGYQTPDVLKAKLSTDYIFPRLQSYFKGEDIIFAETGTIPLGVAPMKLPENSELHSQLLWCSTGWATPASFGAAIANPKARVILITGDGAHQISAMEIGNMCKYGVKPVIIVINNNGYSTERLISGDDDTKFSDIMPFDYAKFARAFKGDIWSTRVETDDDFDKALRVTQIMDKICYIEAVIDKSDSPKIAKEFFASKITSKSEKSDKKEKKSENKKNKKNEEKCELKISVDKSYETNVHTSLKEYEE